jgi:hypothetical protein
MPPVADLLRKWIEGGETAIPATKQVLQEATRSPASSRLSQLEAIEVALLQLHVFASGASLAQWSPGPWNIMRTLCSACVLFKWHGPGPGPTVTVTVGCTERAPARLPATDLLALADGACQVSRTRAWGQRAGTSS